ncbi:MAG: hypothetical protein V1844_13170 [Pseudomonadota bacterium]
MINLLKGSCQDELDYFVKAINQMEAAMSPVKMAEVFSLTGRAG